MAAKKTVDDYVANAKTYKEELIHLRSIILETELSETIKWGMPVYTINNKNLIGISSFKAHFGIWFYQGALLSDPNNTLTNAQEGKTVAMRHWKMRSAEDINEKIILKYITEAINLEKKGHRINPSKIEMSIVIPEALAAVLEKSSELKAGFDQMPPYKRRDFAEYISTAKKEATKLKRLEKSVELIRLGQGLNDLYQKKV